MAILYVASRQAGSGKTALCAALAREMGRQGKQVFAIKPLSGDADSAADRDNGIYDDLLPQAGPAAAFELSGRGLTKKVLEQVTAACERAGEGQDLLLVEGTSGLSESGSARLTDALDAKVVVVERYDSGLDASALAGWRRVYGDRLVGIVINGLTRYQASRAEASLLPSMSSAGLVSLGVIPEDRTLLGVSVGQLADHLEGRYVGEESRDGLVEHILVGGMGLDSGELYFGTRENKAVIVRGDRPDVQMSALATPTSCMVLTEGIEPIEYVSYEAELEEVPIIVVQSDTLTTMASLNGLMDRASFDHPAKLERFADLLGEHLDTEALYAGLGLAA